MTNYYWPVFDFKRQHDLSKLRQAIDLLITARNTVNGVRIKLWDRGKSWKICCQCSSKKKKKKKKKNVSV
jgi:hypothetical protein